MLHILGEALRGRWWFGEIFGNSSLYIGYVLGKILRDSEPRQRRHHTCVPFTGSWEGGCDSRLDISLFLVVRPPRRREQIGTIVDDDILLSYIYFYFPDLTNLSSRSFCCINRQSYYVRILRLNACELFTESFVKSWVSILNNEFLLVFRLLMKSRCLRND